MITFLIILAVLAVMFGFAFLTGKVMGWATGKRKS
tara:strand:+ start:5239 stop:5343 length:105 start_codon:yes stop_codon:yes gene_type:complete